MERFTISLDDQLAHEFDALIESAVTAIGPRRFATYCGRTLTGCVNTRMSKRTASPISRMSITITSATWPSG